MDLEEIHKGGGGGLSEFWKAEVPPEIASGSRLYVDLVQIFKKTYDCMLPT
jgi:hypothetical protein